MTPTVCEACVLESSDLRRVQVVENDWQWLCPHCRKTTERQPFAEADAALADIASEARRLPDNCRIRWISPLIGQAVRMLQALIDLARREM